MIIRLIGIIVVALHAMVGNIVAMDRYGWPMRDISKTFLALVSAQTLDRNAFLNHADEYCGINEQRMGDGFTPLHVLLSRLDATIELVDVLIKKGALLNVYNYPRRYSNEYCSEGKTPYEEALWCWLISPRSEGYKPETYSSKAVLNHVFAIELCKRLISLERNPRALRYRSIETLAHLVGCEEESRTSLLEISLSEKKELQEAVVVRDLNI